MISSVQDVFKPESFELMMLLHLCDNCDVHQASFTFQRAPEETQKDKAVEAAKALTDNLKELKFKDALASLGDKPAHKILKRVL